MRNSLVSIIIPVYNVEKYLVETLNGIIKQSYDNLEIILVDDGSTDNSAQICKDFMKKDSRIHYYYQENSGAPSARNCGLDKSNGEYVLLFDSDDILLSNAIELMLNKAIEDDSDLVVGNYAVISSQKETIQFKNINKTIDEIHKLYFISPFPNNKLIRSNVIKNVRFDDVRIAQDANFFYKIIPFIEKYSTVDQCVCKYRILETSISSKCDSRILDVIKSIGFVKKYYDETNVPNVWYIYLMKAKFKHLLNQVYKVVNSSNCKQPKELLRQLTQELHKTLLIILPKCSAMIIKDYIYFIFLRIKYIFK